LEDGSNKEGWVESVRLHFIWELDNPNPWSYIDLEAKLGPQLRSEGFEELGLVLYPYVKESSSVRHICNNFPF